MKRCSTLLIVREMQIKIQWDITSHQSQSVQFSHSVMSDSLWPHGLQHTRLPCPSPSPRACSNSCQSSWWCHPTISSSVIPFSSCLQSFPASGPFLKSQLFPSGGQSIGASASASILPINIQLISFWIDWFDLLAGGSISQLFFNSWLFPAPLEEFTE